MASRPTVPDVECIRIKMASFGWCCGLIRRKEVSFIVLLLLLGLVLRLRLGTTLVNKVEMSLSKSVVGICFLYVGL